MKLIIDRSKWLHGEGAEASRLLRPNDGKMCCLGQFALVCGISPDSISDERGPTNIGMRSNENWNALLIDDEKATNNAYDLMKTNDRPDSDAYERECEIALIFARIGVEATFIDGAA